MSKLITVQKYYDVQCDICGRFLSTDFARGMAFSTKQARNWAKQEGFSVDNKNGNTVCRECKGELS